MVAAKLDRQGIEQTWSGGFADSKLSVERLAWALRKWRAGGNQYPPSTGDLIKTARWAGINDEQAKESFCRCTNHAATQNWPAMTSQEFVAAQQWGAGLSQAQATETNVKKWHMMIADASFIPSLAAPPPRPVAMITQKSDPEKAKPWLDQLKKMTVTQN